MTNAQLLRNALANLPEGTSHGDSVPSVADVYLPRSHLKAMDPDASVVVGMRGAGKTFWWNALQNTDVRALVGQSGLSRFNDATEVKAGFGVSPAPEDYPSKDVLAQLLADRVAPRVVWRTVLARHLTPKDGPLRDLASWRERCEHVENRPDEIDLLMHRRDVEFAKRQRHLLILFDALDRCADDWKDMYRLIRGLMQLVLDVRSYKRIRVKVFLRTDQVDDTKIGDFPDASKVFSSSVELNWPPNELYGLLWHCMANGCAGEVMRTFLAGERWEALELKGSTVFTVPREFVFREQTQRDKFHVIAGPWMGRDRRRGFPYTWIPNHLADTEGKVSPRSFLAALRTAASNTQDRHPGHKYALHYDSIKQGVQEASKIRVREFREDYPWVHRVLGSLEGMVVPCSFDEVEERWEERDVLGRLADDTDHDDVRLPPRHIDRGPEGMREDLEALSIFQQLRDGRVNIPDVFRVGYGLGRRGGVKPVKPTRPT